MEHSVLITIPDQICHRHVEQTAEATRQTIAQVLSEHVIETFQPFPSIHISPNRSLMMQEVAAYESMHAQLVKQFLGQYVAIYEGKLVDHDVDEESLMIRRRRDYSGKVVLVRQVEQEASQDLVLRSPRFVA